MALRTLVNTVRIGPQISIKYAGTEIDDVSQAALLAQVVAAGGQHVASGGTGVAAARSLAQKARKAGRPINQIDEIMTVAVAVNLTGPS